MMFLNLHIKSDIKHEVNLFCDLFSYCSQTIKIKLSAINNNLHWKKSFFMLHV